MPAEGQPDADGRGRPFLRCQLAGRGAGLRKAEGDYRPRQRGPEVSDGPERADYQGPGPLVRDQVRRAGHRHLPPGLSAAADRPGPGERQVGGFLRPESGGREVPRAGSRL